MIVKFSRHARRRAKLYKIPETIVKEILEDTNLSDGEHEIIRDVTGFRYPIKIVVVIDGDTFTVITNYPLKKGTKNQYGTELPSIPHSSTSVILMGNLSVRAVNIDMLRANSQSKSCSPSVTLATPRRTSCPRSFT